MQIEIEDKKSIYLLKEYLGKWNNQLYFLNLTG